MESRYLCVHHNLPPTAEWKCQTSSVALAARETSSLQDANKVKAASLGPTFITFTRRQLTITWLDVVAVDDGGDELVLRGFREAVYEGVAIIKFRGDK